MIDQLEWDKQRMANNAFLVSHAGQLQSDELHQDEPVRSQGRLFG